MNHPASTHSATPSSPPVRLGARGSLLSRLQSGQVSQMLQASHRGLVVELNVIKTSGDRIQDRPLHEFGGKGLFTKELELALLEGQVDFVVHSFKDVPVTMPLVAQQDLLIAAVPRRADPRDVLASTKARSLKDLPAGAKVGTGSLRRQSQILALRPDLQVVPIRGNVDTRLRKLEDGEYDAVILALAGAKRSGLFDGSFMTPIDSDTLLPAAGQGALALQCRKADTRMRELLAVLNDPVTFQCVELERAVVKQLEGDCHSPIAALAEMSGSTVRLRAVVAGRDGRPPLIRAEAHADIAQAHNAVDSVIAALNAQGAHQLLHG
ncbi:MAG: hydroxymethylbilane synthase [Phycisphaerae bacterium]